MNDTAQVLILKQTDYREADVIINALSKEYGKISFIARGARRPSSKNAAALLPATEALIQFDYSENRSIFSLKTARTLSLFRHVHESLEVMAAANVVCEAADVLIQEGDAACYDRLREALNRLQEGQDHATVTVLFVLWLMQNFGIAPHVDGCLQCGKPKAAYLSVKEGGFLCSACTDQMTPLADLSRFRLLVKGNMLHADQVLAAVKAQKSDLEAVSEIIRIHTGMEIRSFSFYLRLF
ncbi:MAG: DNA repair protein RecO [Solobacterium sp.]|nr:DNA repair protein RecO [Solobacterium sp.]